MLPDPDACYAALLAHDARFDGRLYVGVRSTGVYCRPVCRVRTPKAGNCRFFSSAAAAERHGFRPCLRCRPELAPGRAGIDIGSRLAQGAARLIEAGELDRGGVEGVAARVGTSSRHLRRVFNAEFGVTPLEYAQTHRLLLAKRLLTDTALPTTEIAAASGFNSLRRFNAAFRERYRFSPTQLRARAGARPEAAMRFRLAYRPPCDWQRSLAFLAARAIERVETVAAGTYRRTVRWPDGAQELRGWLAVRPMPSRALVEVELSASLAAAIPPILRRIRDVFDLDCEPGQVRSALPERSGERAPMRLVGAFDGFELAVRGIVGQQVSVKAARTVVARLAERFGDPLDGAVPAGLERLFPAPATIAALDVAAIAELGILGRRAEAIRALARAIVEGRLVLEPRAPVDATIAALQAIPGIGDWTAQYVVMRALCWPDAFPAGDLAVLRALGARTPAQARERARKWQPWRAYAVMDLWASIGATT
ncbi:MAG: helix-turn-helix domain-containing protein [Burkholderiaceae bacterium]|nr:helix-turn-helix domain-containing protein [Burkholderiaceae bacterium]